jgi:hypothetical protein
MPFSTATKNAMLDAITFNEVRLHNGLPGAAGTDNELLSGVGQTAVFNAASGGARALNAGVPFTGLTGSAPVTYFSVWTASGAVFRGSGQITTGDTAANASGEYTLQTGTELQLNDS